VYDLGDRLPEPGRRSRLSRLWSAFGHDLAVDLGTANTLVYVRGKGVVLTQPSCVALDRQTARIIAVGDDAREMIGRAPANIEVIRPLRSGVISDYEATQHMLREFILRVHHRTRFVKPRVIVCVPSGVSQIARRAVEEAVIEAGARRVVIVSEPLAAAVGAGLPIEEPRGSMIIDIGGGTTEVAVFVLGGIVTGTSEPVAGDAVDQAIVAYVRKERAILIGERMAERLKVSAAAAVAGVRRVRVQFPGKDLTTGRPTRVDMTSDELAEGISEPVGRIVDSVVGVLDRMPADIVPDLLQSGVVMTGGGSLLIGLDGLVEAECGLPVKVDPEPLSCVVRGAGSVLESLGMGSPRPRRSNLKSDDRYDSRRRGERDRRRR
jgi:rod shape-determining protein MreB and related proteins